MIAKDRGRGFVGLALGLAVALAGLAQPANAQDDAQQRYNVPPPAPRTTKARRGQGQENGAPG